MQYHHHSNALITFRIFDYSWIAGKKKFENTFNQSKEKAKLRLRTKQI
jgi:hypothetical protein